MRYCATRSEKGPILQTGWSVAHRKMRYPVRYPWSTSVPKRRTTADATLPRASEARPIAVRLDAVLVPRGQRAVARLGDGDWVRGPIIHDPAVDRDPEGESRHSPLVGAYGRVCRRPDDHSPRHRHSELRRAVRARQRGLDLDGGDRDPPHEHDRIGRDADALPDEHYDLVHSRAADARVPSPAPGGRADARACPFSGDVRHSGDLR